MFFLFECWSALGGNYFNTQRRAGDIKITLGGRALVLTLVFSSNNMSKFDLKAYYEKYPNRVDRFKDQEAFLEFVAATTFERRVITTSYQKTADYNDPEFLARVQTAWGIQDTNGYETYLRVFTLLTDDNGELKVYYDNTDLDFWNKSGFVQTPLSRFVFKFHRPEEQIKN
jgi:hypothetical protein